MGGQQRNVWLSQVNYRYGNSLFLPYSAGCLWAYSMAQPTLRENYRVGGWVVEREPLEDVLSRMDDAPPDVLAVSCYIWNWNYSNALASAVRARYPDCGIVFGGPQVQIGWREAHVDTVIHHEGEVAFASVLHNALSVDHGRWTPATLDLPRVADLSTLPSPYLSGVFVSLMQDHRYDDVTWDASQETHRGCPYSCTFCDWGSAVLTKVRRFPTERLYGEIEWFGRNAVGLLYNCDANFGLFQDDEEFTARLVDTKRVHGYPERFRAAYAKNSNERVFCIAKALNEAGMEKGVTLSFQSLDQHALTAVKRKNMAVNDFKALLLRYRGAQPPIPTYTELILPLPGETLRSFKDGVSMLLDAGQHDSLNVYNCKVLPNAEMAGQEYRQTHGLQTLTVHEAMEHSVPDSTQYQEVEELVIGTQTMPTGDWKEAYAFSILVQGLHSLGLTQHVAIFARAFGVPYHDFYSHLLELQGLRQTADDAARALLDGRASNQSLPGYGSIVWNPEERLFLSIAGDEKRREKLQSDVLVMMTRLLHNNGHVTESLLQDLLAYQALMTSSPVQQRTTILPLKHDLVSFFEAAPDETRVVRRSVSVRIAREEAYEGDVERWAREVVWWGRKASKWRPASVRVI